MPATQFYTVSLSPEELKKTERKLPSVARARLRALRTAAAKASAQSDARWIQQQNDVQKRHRLSADVARAEADLRHEHHRIGHTREWRDGLRQQFEESLSEAQEALKDFNLECEARSNDRVPDEGGLAEKCEAFLMSNARAVFREVVVPLPAKVTFETLSKIRDDITRTRTAIQNIDNAPLTYDEAMQVVDLQINKLASDGAPDLFGPTRFAYEHSDKKRAQGRAEWPEHSIVMADSLRKIPNAFSFVFWAFKDVLREKLAEAVRATLDRSAFQPISATDRDKRKAELAAELLALERTEESIISHLQSQGDTRAVRRQMADPRALLCVEIVGTREVKHSGPGSAAEGFYEPPKMVVPEGQSLPRSSQWMENGRDAVAEAKK